MREFAARLGVLPFDSVLAAWTILGGVIGLLNLASTTPALDLVLPSWAVVAFEWGYLVSGLGWFLGLGFGRRDIEAGGLIVVTTSVLIRIVALVVVFGIDAQLALSYLFFGAFIVAAIRRLVILVRGDVIVRAGT